MEKLYNYAETAIINYKLKYCCWVAPVKIGIYILAYFNLFAAYLSLVGTANDSFPTTLMKVQETIIEDYVSKPVPILAYSTELSFTVLLLCGMYRKDPTLLRVYIFYSMAASMMSIMVYSMVIAAVDVFVIIAIIFSTAYQIYMCILVWSVMVELRDGPSTNGEVKVAYKAANEEVDISKPDAETPAEPEPEAGPAPEHRDTKLETVNEDPKES